MTDELNAQTTQKNIEEAYGLKFTNVDDLFLVNCELNIWFALVPGTGAMTKEGKEKFDKQYCKKHGIVWAKGHGPNAWQ